MRLVATIGLVLGLAGPAGAFETWSDDLFARARAEHRYVLLDLGASGVTGVM